MEKSEIEILKDLQTIWNNFLIEKNEQKKEIWINLFLYIYKNFYKCTVPTETASFLNSVPSQLCSYMLQLVYEIISISIENSTTEPEESYDYEIPSKNILPKFLNDTFTFSSSTVSLSQLIVGAPSDITAIISLRRFLTHGLGGEILDFLNKCDIKPITSKRDLSNLLVNLFPNSPWDDNGDNIENINGTNQKDTQFIKENSKDLQQSVNKSQDIYKFIENFKLHEIFHCTKTQQHDLNPIPVKKGHNQVVMKMRMTNNNKNINNASSSIRERLFILFNDNNEDYVFGKNNDNGHGVKSNNHNIFNYHEQMVNKLLQSYDLNTKFKYEQFQSTKQQKRTSSDIASILIELLIKLVKEETELSLDEHSVTIQCLKFALDNLNEIEKTNAFIEQNVRGAIKLKILSLIAFCLNNLLARKENLLLFDVKMILKNFFDHFTVNCCAEGTDYQQIFNFQVIFLIFGILVNVMSITTMNNTNLLNFLNENTNDIQRLIDVMKNYLIQNCNDQNDNNHFKIIIDLLISLIKTVKFMQLEKIKYKKSAKKQKLTSTLSQQLVRPVLLRASTASLALMRSSKQQIHCKRTGFPCLFENILIEIFSFLNPRLQEHIVTYFRVNGLCCCLYNIDKLQKLLFYSEHSNSMQSNDCNVKIQKLLYKFLRYKVLKVIFSKTMVSCAICDEKLKSNELHNQIFLLYKQKYENISEISDNENKVKTKITQMIFLKHLLKISNLITVNITGKILSEIVLPIFRSEIIQFKQEQYELQQSPKDDDLNEDLNSCKYKKNVMLECLYIFVNYLNDIRLIKEFYILENIAYLEDLQFIPEFSRTISDLIRIGCNNYAYLGETVNEQQKIQQKLFMIQIHATMYITDMINEIFTCQNARIFFQKFIEKNEIQKQIKNNDCNIIKNHDDSNPLNPIKELLKTKQLKISYLLHLASIYWNLTLNLFKNNQKFRGILLEAYEPLQELFKNDEILKNLEKNSMFQLIYNCLITFLYYNNLQCDAVVSTTAINSTETTNNVISLNLMNNNYHTWNLYRTPSSSGISSDSWPQPKESNYYSFLYTNKETNTNNVTVSMSLFQQQSIISNHHNDIDEIIQSIANTSIPDYNEFSITFDLHENESFGISEKTLNIFPDIKHENFLDLIKFYDNNIYINCSFLQNFESLSDCEEYIVIFDIKNQQNKINNIKSTLNFCENLQKNTCYDDENTVKLRQEVNNQSNNYSNNQSLIFKCLQNFASYLGVNNLPLFSTEGQQECNDKSESSDDNNTSTLTLPNTSENTDELITKNDFLQLCQSADSKKYLMQIFECVLTIIIMSNDELKVLKMQQLLRKLKILLISYSEKYWECENNACAIIHSLQSLLKVAEMVKKKPTNYQYPTSAENQQQQSIKQEQQCPTSSIRMHRHDTGEDTIVNNCSATTATVTTTTTTTTSAESEEIDLICSSSKLSYTNNTIFESDDEDNARCTITDDFLLSENETEECYVTADEGYEADAELPEITENDENIDELWNPYVPSSRYRTTIVHDGICKIIVEILIELSAKCVANPSLWSSNLSQLANRLYIIREALGGPLFLLKGFMPILTCNNPRLRDFQQSILDLITDFNSPEVLSTYFNIIATENPPVEILIRYMAYICSLGLKVQPKAEVIFPQKTDGILKSTCNPILFNQIKQYRNYHEYHNLETALTNSALIVPLDNTKFWQSDGFTASLWVQVKSCFDSSIKTSPQSGENTVKEENDKINATQTHLISFGSNQLLLNIYLNDNMNLVFETSRPYIEVQPTNRDQKNTKTTTAVNSNSTASGSVPTSAKDNKTLPTKQKPSTLCIFKRKRKFQKNSPNLEDLTITSSDTSNKENIALNRNQPSTSTSPSSPSPLTNALQSTKLAIINSFSQFQLFSSQNDNQSSSFENNSVVLQTYRLSRKKWTHICFAVDLRAINQKNLQITCIIDGSEEYTVQLPIGNFQQITRNEQFQICCLGQSVYNDSKQQQQQTDDIENSHNHIEYSVSTVMIFQKCFNRKSLLANLTALGPDCSNLTFCQVGNMIPNYGFLNFHKANIMEINSFTESIATLCDALTVSYSAHQPNHMIGFQRTENGSCEGYRLGAIYYEPGLSTCQTKSIQSAVYFCGGLSCLLYLFARTVELTTDSNTQAFALDLLLSIARSDAILYTEFVRKDYLNLIGYVIRTDKCTKDVYLLKNLVNNACTKQVITKRNDGSIIVIENTLACVIYPNVIISVIRRYSDWHKYGLRESKILDTLLSSIYTLVREKHPHQEFNIAQLQKAGIIKELLNLCKVNVVEAPSPVYISVQAAELFVNILSIFAGSPPSPSLLDEIMKLLLVLHKPSECFVTHDRSKFYFLISPDPPLKQKLLNLQLPSRQFTQIIRERKQRIMTVASTTRLTQFKRNSRDRSSFNKLQQQQQKERQSQQQFTASDTDKYERTRIPVFESLRSLRNITDCSRIANKNIISAFNAIEAQRFNSSLFNMKKQRAYFVQDQRNRNRKISRKRLRFLSRLNSENEYEKKRKKDKSISDSSEKDLDIFTSKEYDVVLSDEVSSLNDSKELCKKRFKTFSSSLCKSTEYTEFPGMIRLQEKLFLLLKNFLLILPDSMIDEVLIHYIKIEILLVLANNKNTNVRSAIIKLFAALCDRLPPGEIQMYTKKFYWHHLANQISLNPTDRNLIESVVHWCTGICHNVNELQHYDDIKIVNKFGLNSLIAILPQTLNDCDLAVSCFQFVENVFVKVPDCNLYLTENGCIQSIVKALYKLYSKSKPVMNNKVEGAIVSLLTTIAQTSVKSSGQINVLWELLNLLSFYQENNVLNVVEAFRAVQAFILYSLLQSFLPSTTMSISLNKFRSSDLHLQNSQISSSEIKTRFDLLVDRSSQFFITANPTHKPTVEEIKLFELMVPLGTSGNTRCNNFIAWGLLPSRPIELRMSIINSLWKICRGENIPSIVCDGKIIKTLLWLCLTQSTGAVAAAAETSSDDNSYNEQYIETLSALCRRLGIGLNETWNVDGVLDKLETNRDNCIRDQKPNIDKTVYKYEAIAQSCIDSSMIITRIVTELQNAERKTLIGRMKEYDESIIFREWIAIIQNMTNEGAPWYYEKIYPRSWELDDTEGPSRVRVRLKRCNLDINEKFILPELRNPPYPKRRPLDYLISTYDQHVNFSLNSKILYNFTAKYLPLDGEIDGDILITDTKLYFVATYRCKFFYIFCNIQNITEIWLRRYQHQEKAFEIFLSSNKSLLFTLQNHEDFKIIKEIFSDKIIQCPDQSKLLLITQQWREGQLTNWEYLMHLNQYAGRTYNDLMQYPVFPWILSNFQSETLDLLDVKNYRKLDKPIAIQHEGSENHYISNYNYISNTITNLGTLQLKPYHYSSHYSNSGTVLHFLVRVPPFTTYFLRYQDNNFDIPDRTFHSINTTWKLASKDSPTDVKELIPEFFCLPEMFENFEGFNFGHRQSGEIVDHVKLPPWCSNNARLFVLIHRQALESEIVRVNLHNWIDLIFGYKQTGPAAVEAVNVFHPATYADFSVTEISDPIERKAVETMVKTYGQMPKQLLKIPHPPSSDLNYPTSEPFVISSVRGLRWGIFTGSPQLPKPRCLHKYRLAEMAFNELISFKNTNVIYGLPEKSCVMQGPEPDTYNLISWNYDDNVVRIHPLSEPTMQSKPLLLNDQIDEITAHGSDPNSNSLWFGHKSGRISIYLCANYDNEKYIRSRQSSTGIKLSYNSAFRTISFRNTLKSTNENDYETRRSSRGSSSFHEFNSSVTWQGPIHLIRHADEVTAICLSTEFQIAVSVGRDGLAVIWDSNTYSYIRTIERPFEIQYSPISVVTISPTLGDILTVHTIEKCDGNQNNSIKSNITTTNGNDNDECFEVTEENLEDFVNISMNLNGKSIMRLHSVNAKYVNHYVLEDKKILSACYSYIKEGTGINVIATGLEDGMIRFWSSWDLSFIQEITISNSDIISITYSTYQHLIALTKDNFIHVWESEGIAENSPKFPQIFFNKANSIL